jgi:hypothetical protein
MRLFHRTTAENAVSMCATGSKTRPAIMADGMRRGTLHCRPAFGSQTRRWTRTTGHGDTMLEVTIDARPALSMNVNGSKKVSRIASG